MNAYLFILHFRQGDPLAAFTADLAVVLTRREVYALRSVTHFDLCLVRRVDGEEQERQVFAQVALDRQEGRVCWRLQRTAEGPEQGVFFPDYATALKQAEALAQAALALAAREG